MFDLPGLPADLLDRVLTELREDALLALDGSQLTVRHAGSFSHEGESGLNQLLTCVGDLKSLLDLATGSLVSRPIPFDLNVLVSKMAASFSSQALPLGLEVCCHYHKGLAAQRVSEPEVLRTLLRQLLTRSLRYSKDAIHIEIDPGPVPDQVVIRVSGAGGGMSATMQRELLEAARLESTTLALRLTLVRLLSARLGGQLSVRGEDIVIKLMLPASGERTEAATTPPAGDLRNRRVLLLEQRPIVRRLLEGLLSSYGVILMQADGSANKADAVILETSEMNDEVAEQIRSLRWTFGEAVPILVLASNPQRDDAARCHQLGCQAFLSRPFLQEQLLWALESSLASPRQGALLTKHNLVESVPPQVRVGILDPNSTSRIALSRQVLRLGHLPRELDQPTRLFEALDNGVLDVALAELGLEVEPNLELARMVRSLLSAGSRVPLLGLGDALPDADRAELLKAGFSEILLRPFSFDELARKVMFWGARQGAPEAVAPVAAPPVDVDVLRQSSMNDPRFERELADVFLVESRATVELLRKSWSSARAHSMKGSANVMGALTLGALLARLERHHDEAGLDELEQEHRRVERWLRDRYS